MLFQRIVIVSALKCNKNNLLCLQGLPGLEGTAGRDGDDCRVDLDYFTGNMLVRHSQSSSIPLCSDDEIKLWDGYSLLYIEGNEKSHHQDLGESSLSDARHRQVFGETFLSYGFHGLEF